MAQQNGDTLSVSVTAENQIRELHLPAKLKSVLEKAVAEQRNGHRGSHIRHNDSGSDGHGDGYHGDSNP